MRATVQHFTSFLLFNKVFKAYSFFEMMLYREQEELKLIQSSLSNKFATKEL